MSDFFFRLHLEVGDGTSLPLAECKSCSKVCKFPFFSVFVLTGFLRASETPCLHSHVEIHVQKQKAASLGECPCSHPPRAATVQEVL